jgi:AmmeMemoRadiSam system protein B
MNTNLSRPKLRPLDFQPVRYQNQRMWFLRDPWQLSDQQLLLPEPLALLAELCDGTRDLADIRAAFLDSTGVDLELEVLQHTLAQLDDACLLENERSRLAQDKLLAAYHAQPYRPPALAGHSYPADPAELSALLQSYGEVQAISGWNGRGLVSPHIDYQRGGPVYAQVWNSAAEAVLAADLVVILGTDHMGGLGTITLTEQPYATPYGLLPTDRELIGRLAAAIGPEAAFADELNHRQEHSVELSAVWLHYITQRAGAAPKVMVPVLVGSFQQFVQTGSHPSQDARLNAFITALRAEASTRRVLFIASVDLAHVGPNFGDPFAMDRPRRERLAAQDASLMAAAACGDAQTWYAEIAAVQNSNRICGFAPTYLMLDTLGQTKGVQLAYDQCPADEQDASLVSICGLLLE